MAQAQDEHEIHRLAEAFCRDELDDRQRGRLDTLIRANEDLRKQYLHYLHMHVCLCRAFEGPATSLAAVPGSCKSISDGITLATPAARATGRSVWPYGRRFSARFWATVTALTVVFLAPLVLLVGSRWQQPEMGQPASESLPPIVAHITGQHECQWAKDRWHPQYSGHLRQGRELNLAAGLLEITYDSGARLILEGPAKYRVDDKNAGALDAGKLTARVPEEAIGFAVKTPRATITDLGTEFGVEVGPLGQIDVVVFHGTVELAQNDVLSASRQQLRAGDAAHVDQHGTIETIDGPREQLSVTFWRQLPGRPVLGAYDDRVLADRPVAYWPLSEESGRVAYDVAGEHHGRVLGVAQRQNDSWPYLALAGRGLIEVSYHPDVNPNAFTVEAWVNPSSVAGYGAVISSRDDRIRNGFILYSAPEDRWAFWVGDGQQNWQMVDAMRDTNGVWTHVVASFEPKDDCVAGICRGIQRLYVNGQLVAEDHDAEYLPHEEQPHALRIGAGANEKEPSYFLHGKIARVAVYDRVLSSETIRSHYEAK